MKKLLFSVAVCGLMFLGGSLPVSADEGARSSDEEMPASDQENAFPFLYGIGAGQNIPYGLELIERDAMAGNSSASCLLGTYYIYGSFGLDNPAKGVEWLRKSAEAGNAAAMGVLSMCYVSGHGVGQDLDKAFLLAKLAVEKGEDIWCAGLGWMYAQGIGTARDEAAAASCYLRAALNGKVNSMYNLGLCYAMGQGVPHLLETGEAWLKLASAGGDKWSDCALEAIGLARSTKPVSESELGSLSAEECYAQAVCRIYVEGNKESAAPFLQRAADLGCGAAVALQAEERMLPNLSETERDALLNKLSVAAESGCMHAVLLMSSFYNGAGGVGLNSEESRKWTLECAELGHGPAAYEAGSWYFNASGLSKPDLEKVRLWYKRAAESGYSAAKVELAEVEKLLRLKSSLDESH